MQQTTKGLEAHSEGVSHRAFAALWHQQWSKCSPPEVGGPCGEDPVEEQGTSEDVRQAQSIVGPSYGPLRGPGQI